jgi:hypothetical protein
MKDALTFRAGWRLWLGWLLVLLVAGCGGSGSAGSGATAADEGPAKTATEAEPAVELKPPKGPSREFFVPGGEDNIVQVFGHEGTLAERKKASGMISAWMRARTAGRWSEVCRYVHQETVSAMKSLASNETGREVTACPEALRIMTAATPPKPRVNTMTGPIDSLRIEKNQAFGQYHGRRGRDWVVLMKLQQGQWKIVGLDPIPRCAPREGFPNCR